MRPIRVYTDTSVIGGCFDDEFKKESVSFFRMAQKGDLTLLLSEVVLNEVARAPQQVQKILALLPPEAFEMLPLTTEAITLRSSYISAKILGSKSINDATHVALATISRADAIVSWNFKHIVHLDKMKQFNAVNLMNGYGVLTIVTPREVVPNE